MKGGWTKKKLGEILKLEYGKPLSREKRKDNGRYPVYGANGEIARTDEYYYDRPSIIIGRKGSAGEINLSEMKFWPLDVTYYVTFDDQKFDRSFIYYLLKTLDLKSLAKGVKPGINRNEVYSIGISYPSLSDQRRIVVILDEAFAAIDKSIQNTRKNLQNVRELFSSHAQQIFLNNEYEWKKVNLGNICENLDSKRIPITKRDRKKGKYPYYGASGIVDYVNDYIFNEDLLLVSEDGANLLTRTYPIAFSISGKTWVNNHAHVLRFNNIYIQKFVEFYLNSIRLDLYISGMAQPKLNQKQLCLIKIPYPNFDTMKKIVDNQNSLIFATKNLEKIYQQKLAELEELRKSLLHKAFMGNL